MDEDNDNNEIVSQIIQNADGEFKVSLPAEGNFDRKCRRRIESKTKTRIKMPRKMPYEKPDECIEVLGSTRSAVEAAMNEIGAVVALQKGRLTHFLSIPIDDEGIIEKFIQFKNDVSLANADVTEEYFQKTNKLHLTLGVLSLFNDDRNSSALKALQECREIIVRAKERINNPGDLRIKILGVNCMSRERVKNKSSENGSSTHCKVLYGTVESDILQTIANEIVAHLHFKGCKRLMDDDKSEVKLHLTLMNVIFVKRITGKRPKRFDATSIVDKFSTYKFGEQKIEKIHLSRFQRIGGSAYYESEGTLDI